jgi:hypothetical protein
MYSPKLLPSSFIHIYKTIYKDCCIPGNSAGMSKGSTWNDEVTKDTPDLASTIPDGDAVFQIHCLERSAYASVLRAFGAVTNHLSWVYLSAVLNFFLYTVVITHFSLISLDYHICVALSLHFLHHILTARSYSYRSCFLLN